MHNVISIIVLQILHVTIWRGTILQTRYTVVFILLLLFWNEIYLILWNLLYYIETTSLFKTEQETSYLATYCALYPPSLIYSVKYFVNFFYHFTINYNISIYMPKNIKMIIRKRKKKVSYLFSDNCISLFPMYISIQYRRIISIWWLIQIV